MKVLTGFENKVSDDNPNRDLILEIIKEIEEENQRLEQEFHDLALSCAEADYEYIPKEYRTPYNHKAATEFMQIRYNEYLEQLHRGSLIINISSIRELIVSAWKNVEVNGRSYIVKSVFVRNDNKKDLKAAILDLAERRAAREMGLYYGLQQTNL